MQLSDLLLGVATGVPVMIVVGPVALLLVEQGMRHGFAAGLPAAAGVATTDLTFSVAASLVGAGAVGLLAPVQPVMHLGTFIVLLGLAAHIWTAARSELTSARAATMAFLDHAIGSGSPPAPGRVATKTSVQVERSSARAGALGRAGAFFALTAANPVTLLVFASLVLSGRTGIGTSGWVLGMTIASLAVSTMYVAVGHVLGLVLTEVAIARLRMAGSVGIAGLGAWFLLVGA